MNKKKTVKKRIKWAICPNCEKKAPQSKIEYLGDEKYECPECKIEHTFVCDYCGKPATINIQNWWHKYEILPNGETEEIKDWEGDTNEFYCDECAEKEGV